MVYQYSAIAAAYDWSRRLQRNMNDRYPGLVPPDRQFKCWENSATFICIISNVLNPSLRNHGKLNP